MTKTSAVRRTVAEDNEVGKQQVRISMKLKETLLNTMSLVNYREKPTIEKSDYKELYD